MTSSPVRERDACAIIALVDKRGRATHANIVQTIDALRKMGHRSGDIHGEGDGCGISADIPRAIWARRLDRAGLSPHLAESEGFFVGHFLLPAAIRGEARRVKGRVRRLFAARGAELLLELEGRTRDGELGPRARSEAPLFWQVAGTIPDESRQASARRLFRLQMAIEEAVPDLHIASLSLDNVVFKLRGLPELLPRVFPELLDPGMRSVITLGHSRYSTNTLPTVERAQPFSLLGHNGEINTIERLRSTGRVMGIEPVPGGSDSQDLNRVIEGLANLYDLDILEALEMVFPAIHTEVERGPGEIRPVYDFYRWFFPCSAQGPAAVVARYGDVCMGSVDALGLRPLWFGESDYDYFLSSEKGVVDLKRTMRDPRPLAPGEKVAILGGRGRRAEVLDYSAIQRRLARLMENRRRARRYLADFHRVEVLGDDGNRRSAGAVAKKVLGEGLAAPARLKNENAMAAFGWQKYDLEIRRRVTLSGREVIGSMGHTGPLAAFVPEALPNVADFFKENVAVVTNPAIDREREAEHFTTRTILGSRPDIKGDKRRPPLAMELRNPLLLGGGSLDGLLDARTVRSIAREFGTAPLEDVLAFFTSGGRDPGRVRVLDITFQVEGEGIRDRLEALAREAKRAVRAGAVVLLLDDTRTFRGGRVYIDPAVALAYVGERLVQWGLRRETSLVVRSGAIRNLHDVMFLLGLGADALNPYLLWRSALDFGGEKLTPAEVVRRNMAVLQKGIEKVMSTMGIHELCGYGRIFSSIGLAPELARIMQMPNFCPSEEVGLGFARMEAAARRRLERAGAPEPTPVYAEPARNPRVGRVLRSVALGKKGYLEMAEELARIEEEVPTGLRHVLRVKTVPEDQAVPMDEVDISVGRHDMPMVIAAMSFGSQGENSFRAYAEAAKKVNIICMNGEGGEIPDMLGRYRHNRGQQIASGRFGVFMGLLNSADYLEIKIGQGAKPGEGGHLPGTKVSEMVARARHCKPGITLISPSNHHDIYSIEDLAQIITELKTANPGAKVSVKIPVTSGVGTIAVGIAKAGADIVNLSGFEGGTGAAREHAKRFVGLPGEVGVSEAHRSLVESGLRDKVELWVDGGIRSGHEVLRMILLGADRVGLGTVALMGVGCISCRRCHLDRCPRGISTQLRSREEAEAKGVKGFSPRVVDVEAENLARLLRAIGDEIRWWMGRMGQRRLRDLVGRTDLLEQYRMADRVDAAGILRRPGPACQPEECLRPGAARRPLNHLTRLISDIAMERFRRGETEVVYTDEGVRSTDRAVGTYLAGAMEREFGHPPGRRARLWLSASVPGNGLCAFNTEGVDAVVEGGAQDGPVKGSFGGTLAILKGCNLLGERVDGSTGKSHAYGAISGLSIVQNMADSRACIRMSGADAVFGARITEPVRDGEGNIASRAHLKGFAFEYMTGGRAVVLGDPGPWMCAGMTGGVIYQCLYPEFGFDRAALQRRLARGANVAIRAMDAAGLADVRELLGRYIEVLEGSFQVEEAAAVRALLKAARRRFVRVVPKALRPPSAE
ncbi:glutamate synthase [Dissulfurirhabdus thermomarina]|uniref:Glutamate synthase n=1 Tax=Dissulfurirhabdus thermomarina TaxID=1765737 RepID=A0A6N9TPT7_DISTH|nr:glutamate synthase-related protein [Dissulfurirhabdus thermomarina]NDY41457.1 glutamate synthase [Dissulfurirhabdus thermomarina]NMX24261.1 glutamate synthase [Dissulfurirhabdus thermomarina]